MSHHRQADMQSLYIDLKAVLRAHGLHKEADYVVDRLEVRRHCSCYKDIAGVLVHYLSPALYLLLPAMQAAGVHQPGSSNSFSNDQLCR